MKHNESFVYFTITSLFLRSSFFSQLSMDLTNTQKNCLDSKCIVSFFFSRQQLFIGFCNSYFFTWRFCSQTFVTCKLIESTNMKWAQRIHSENEHESLFRLPMIEMCVPLHAMCTANQLLKLISASKRIVTSFKPKITIPHS